MIRDVQTSELRNPRAPVARTNPLYPSVCPDDAPQKKETRCPDRDSVDEFEAQGEPEEAGLQSDDPDFKMLITKPALEQILDDLARPPFRREQGGILFGPEDYQQLVIGYFKDVDGVATYASFTLDVRTLNRFIQRIQPGKLSMVGMIHSHPGGLSHPSGGDLRYLDQIFSNPKNRGSRHFLFPIVANGELYPYVVDTSDVRRIRPVELVVV
ncbi:MAG: Mov34/MPN/PAD-1 family protein [Planctomycetaceae bacterium]|nr:Mov34/MPN/PAD-1 family protein [Planctomycetaceae bacterium]